MEICLWKLVLLLLPCLLTAVYYFLGQTSFRFDIKGRNYFNTFQTPRAVMPFFSVAVLVPSVSMTFSCWLSTLRGVAKWSGASYCPPPMTSLPKPSTSQSGGLGTHSLRFQTTISYFMADTVRMIGLCQVWASLVTISILFCQLFTTLVSVVLSLFWRSCT